MRLSWWISMPGNTDIGSALATAGGRPDASAATATDAVNARSARQRNTASDPSTPARRRPLVEVTTSPSPTSLFRAAAGWRYEDAVSGTALSALGRARFPARWSEDVAQPIAQSPRRPPVAGHRHVLAGLQLPDVEGVDLFGQPVMRAEHLALEAAEYPVPDDEDAAVVLVQVHLVHPMVHAMMRRRVENELQNPR